MRLPWFRKRAPQHTEDNRDDQVLPTSPETGTPIGLKFVEAPLRLKELLATSDFSRALGALLEDRSHRGEIGGRESAYWEIHCLIHLGRLEEATQAAESAIDSYPDCADLYYAQGLAFKEQGRNGDYEEALSMALHYAPASVEVLNLLGDLRSQRRDNETAIKYYEKSLGHAPTAQTANLLARAYSEANRYEEAEATLRRAMEKDPEDPQLLGTLGRTLLVTDRYEEATRIQKRLADRPIIDIQLYGDQAYVHYCLGELDRAKYYLRKILAIEPANFDALYYLGLIQLAEGNFAEAWDNYRWRSIANISYGRHYAFPDWDGKPVQEGNLLIVGEQGLGDQIMFCGCVPQAIAAAGKVVLECDERLTKLFSRSFPEAKVVPWARHTEAPWIRDAGTMACQISMGDLPGLYRRSAGDFPDHGGYLKPDTGKVARWRERLRSLGGSRTIGISWKGGMVKTRRSIRSIDPGAWRPVLSLPDTRFVSLQYGEVDDDIRAFDEALGVDVHHWQEAIDDYDETAALVTALSGVVTVCTSIAHLTGALGRPGWVATPVIPEWRYMTGGDRWFWYPQVALIRQKRLGEWDEVMEEIARRILQPRS